MENKEENGLIYRETFEKSDLFLKDIAYGGRLYNRFLTGDYAFRGQKSAHFGLVPSALRSNCMEIKHSNFPNPQLSATDREQLAFEFDILRQFYLKCDECGLYLPDNKRFRDGQFSCIDFNTINKDGIWLPEDLYDIAALAQHYGLPTRLLDWSYDIGIAIFFAISELIKDNIYDNNDYITIWNLNVSMHTWLNLNFALPGFPLHLIRPIYKYNPNLKAQKGLFSLWSINYQANAQMIKNSNPLDNLILSYFDAQEPRFKYFLSKPLMACFKIRQTRENINNLYEYIQNNNINYSMLFPGYSGVVEYLKYDKIK